ncbi:hypothetical protein Emag_003615 [Eimeria magna]
MSETPEPATGAATSGSSGDSDDPLLDAVTRIESMCPNCEKNGETILFLHRIPHFKDLLISSFSCPHCNYSNREVQAASSLAPRGVHIECKVISSLDLNRQAVRSESCTVKIPEVELEIPPSRERAELNTIEGFVTSFAENLKCAALYQTQINEIATAQKLNQLVEKLNGMAAGKEPFVFELDDPSGNSYIESIDLTAEKAGEAGEKREDSVGCSEGPTSTAEGGVSTETEDTARMHVLQPSDDRIIVRHYERTREQLHAMGYFETQEESPEHTPAGAPDAEENSEQLKDEALLLPVECPHCGTSTTNKVCQVDIPGRKIECIRGRRSIGLDDRSILLKLSRFRECLIFAFSCPSCGAKNSEIKAAGAYGAAGRRWILKVTDSDDLNRDVLKSDMATVEIPSLEFSMEGGAQAGTLTTVEGLLKSLADGLSESQPFACGDSAAEASKKRMKLVCETLRRLQEGHPSVLPFELIISDPADMSFIALKKTEQSKELPKIDASTHVDGAAAKALAAAAAAASRVPGAAISAEDLEKRLKESEGGQILWRSALDDTLTVEVYKRTDEEDDELGLLDMKV